MAERLGGCSLRCNDGGKRNDGGKCSDVDKRNDEDKCNENFLENDFKDG